MPRLTRSSKKRDKPLVGGHQRSDGKPNRVEKRAARRAAHQAAVAAMRTSRTGEKPRQTRVMNNPDDFEAILEGVSSGLTTTAVLLDLGLSFKQFCEALEAQPDGRGRYRRARELQAESWGDEIVAIADEEIEGFDVPGAASAEVSHRTLRVNTRKWLMGKTNPQFADKSTITHTGDPREPIATEDVSAMTPEQRAARYQETLKRMRSSQ